MAYEFRLPDIGEGVAEGEVVKWFVQEGETIREDAPLVSVLTDKANVEIPSPKSGTVVKIHVPAGEKVKVGGLLVTIETSGGSAPSKPAEAPTTPASGPPPATPPPPPPATTPAAPPSGGTGRVLATPYVRRLAAERNVDLSTLAGTGPGGRVTEEDVQRAAGGSSAPTPSGKGEVVPTSRPSAVPAPPLAPAPHEAPSATRAPVPGPSERIPIRGVRRIIADRMAESKHRAAHFTYVEEVEASEMMRLRDKMAKHVEKHGVKLTFLPFIVKGVVAGLRAFPHMNATMDDDRAELVVHKEFHIGIAAAAPDGLLVPVVRNPDRMSITEIAKEIQDLSERARQGKLQRSELVGGSFTITSLGALGGVLATPILNYPEVAILGVHRIVRRPVYLADGSIGPANLMNLSVSLDHRVLDGIVGAQFLAVVKSYLEDPHQLFAELS